MWRVALLVALLALPAAASADPKGWMVGRVYESLGRSDLADAQLELARALTKR